MNSHPNNHWGHVVNNQSNNHSNNPKIIIDTKLKELNYEIQKLKTQTTKFQNSYKKSSPKIILATPGSKREKGKGKKRNRADKTRIN